MYRSPSDTLEVALVRCGYVRDAIYNSRFAGFSGRKEKPTIMHWVGGKILLGARGKDNDSRIGYEFITLSVGKLDAKQLVHVALHLSSFVDALEGNSRHLLTDLERACERVQALIDRVSEDPQPSASPS